MLPAQTLAEFLRAVSVNSNLLPVGGPDAPAAVGHAGGGALLVFSRKVFQVKGKAAEIKFHAAGRLEGGGQVEDAQHQVVRQVARQRAGALTPE